MHEFLKFGTLYLDNIPQPVPNNPIAKNGDIPIYRGQTITIGDTLPGKEITWLKLDDILMADRCILASVSFTALAPLLLRPICVDGQQYVLRLPYLNSEIYPGDEWEKALALCKDEPQKLFYDQMFFWSMNIPNFINPERDHYRIIQGYYGADNQELLFQDYHGPDIGFRPVLMPLNAPIDESSFRESQVLCFYPHSHFRLRGGYYLIQAPKVSSNEDIDDRNDSCDPLHVILAIQSDFLVKYAATVGYSTLEEFLDEYTDKDTDCLEASAQQAGALAFSFCPKAYSTPIFYDNTPTTAYAGYTQFLAHILRSRGQSQAAAMLDALFPF